MSGWPVLVALAALLLAPGPTNALLAIGGAVRGVRAGLPLVVAVLAGYLAIVTPLVLFGRPWLAAHPGLALAVKAAAAVWTLYLAALLWWPAGGDAGLASPRRVLVTTLLNPKGPVIALALLPPDGTGRWLAAFAGLVLAASLVWLAAGARLGRQTAGRLPPLLRRGAAGYLGFVAVGLAASAF